MIDQQQPQKKMKVDKYDRQIRLWGSRGQRCLGQSRVALVKCTGAGIEALKNLILPGVGTVDIWDQSRIRVEDLNSSFFYEQEDVGQFKAEVASRNLLEMNQDSKGGYFVKGVEQFLGDQKAVTSYNLVIFGGELTEEQTRKASETLWKLDIPCIFITVVGFFFYVRLQKRQHFVESSNTMAKKYYLRISDPFPQLLNHAQQNCIYKSLQTLSTLSIDEFRPKFLEFSQIPSVLILISVLNALPKQQRKRNMIKEELNRVLERAHPDYRQNVREAMSGIVDPLQTPDVFMIDIGILGHPSVVGCKQDSHIMLKFLWATGQYFQQTGKLPQPTLLPDMATTTQKYIQLKTIYNKKHNQDTKILIEKIQSKFGDTQIDATQISDYINNLSNLEVVQMRPYYEELSKPDEYSLGNCYDHQKDLLVAVRVYQGLYCGDGKGCLGAYEEVKQRADQISKQYGIQSYDQRYVKEVHRSQGYSHINIYSIAGALAGQEAIKLITGCFCPMNAGYFFDGANGRGYQVKF